ncbi:hypothetical protein OOT55_14285 [Marinimicrobium sp. C6131]|uniref:AAA family ATPase n=1 Tax=Marinimicrobium sp. C6131 TaxID=3022676 RepID=UPI00223D70CA|nr:AAA family ATPase [Marinimicrobium sp. C6131]UZJ43816.1 hypothetical protein OOT55_14285 [Marinimicrobium sp. C6131]
MILAQEYEEVIDAIKKHLYPRRKYLIAIDGYPGTGKSSLSRFLAFKLEMPAIETDLLRVLEEEQPSYRLGELRNLIQSRHDQNRPVIVEGIFTLDTLDKIGLVPDYLIYVDNSEANCGYSLRHSMPEYLEKYKPHVLASYVCNTDFIKM